MWILVSYCDWEIFWANVLNVRIFTIACVCDQADSLYFAILLSRVLESESSQGPLEKQNAFVLLFIGCTKL